MKVKVGLNQKIVLLAVMAVIFVCGAFSGEYAQGAKFGARDPRVCKDKKQPVRGAISAEQAKALVICDTEHIINDLYLAEDVTVEVSKGRPYNIREDINFPDIDIKTPVYPIRGSLKKYSCSSIYLDRSNLNKNCSIYNEPNAKGACYKDTFGDWHCGMTDTRTGDFIATNAPPPGGAATIPDKKPSTNDNPTVSKPRTNETKPPTKTTTNKKPGGYPDPDFSAISDYYELVKFSYDFPNPWLMMTVKLKKDIGQYNSFSVHFFDEDGTEVGEYTHGQPALGERGRAGDTIQTKVGAPTERDMAKVKTVVFRRE